MNNIQTDSSLIFRWVVGESVHPDPCPDCYKGRLILKKEETRLVYRCEFFPKCPGNAGAHKDTGEPLGKAIDKAGRHMRVILHNLLQKYWQKEPFEHQNKIQYAVYNIMALYMGIANFHVALLDKEQLSRAIVICNDQLKGYMKFHGWTEE